MSQFSNNRDENPSRPIRATAQALLAQREHSTADLARKLTKRRYEQEAIDALMQELTQKGLLDDDRFAEMYIRMRSERGMGPLRIRAELQQQGIARETIKASLMQSDEIWIKTAALAREKRFGKRSLSAEEELKQRRFLEYRGFAIDTVNTVLKSLKGAPHAFEEHDPENA